MDEWLKAVDDEADRDESLNYPTTTKISISSNLFIQLTSLVTDEEGQQVSTLERRCTGGDVSRLGVHLHFIFIVAGEFDQHIHLQLVVVVITHGSSHVMLHKVQLAIDELEDVENDEL